MLENFSQDAFPNIPRIPHFPIMKSLLLLTFLLAIPAQAAVSILIQPGPTPETTLFTLTQTSPPLTLTVAGLSGYASGMAIPTAMFNIPGLGAGFSSDITGPLGNSLATINETFSGQSFQLDRLRVSSNSAVASLLEFNSLFVIPNFAASIRFEAISAGPVPTNISYDALFPGTYSTEDTLFGTVTVTVIPEPSGALLLALTSIAFLGRRKRLHG